MWVCDGGRALHEKQGVASLYVSVWKCACTQSGVVLAGLTLMMAAFHLIWSEGITKCRFCFTNANAY